MGGLIEEKLRPKDNMCKELNLEIVSPDELCKNSIKILNGLKRIIKYLSVHWDLDILSPYDFNISLKPYLKDFPWVIGRIKS